MSVQYGPNLVGGSLSDLVIPVLMDHGPWEYGSKLYALCKTDETFGATVIGGASIVYSAASPDGPDNWTREIDSYPANHTFSYYYAQPDWDGQRIIALAYKSSESKYGICEFDCATETYGSVGTLGTLVFSTVYPAFLKRMPDGSTLFFCTGAGGVAGFYRYNSGSWSSFVALNGGNRMVAAVHDGVNNTCHVITVLDSGSKILYYQKVFNDNSKNTESNVLTNGYETVGIYGVQNYGHCYEFLSGKMYVQATLNNTLYSLESSTLDETAAAATFTERNVFELPTPVNVDGSRTLYFGNYVKPASSFYLLAAGIEYDGEGAVVSDKIYASKLTAGVWGNRAEVADFQASPPTIPPPGSIPSADSQYGHFHSMHGLADGTAGTLCDFFVDVGGVFCTTYYTNFTLGGDFSVDVSESLSLGDTFTTQIPETGDSQADSLEFSDSIDLDNTGSFTQTRQDQFNLSDRISLQQSSISGPGSGETGGTPGGSGGFPTGGPTNQPEYCIFEFYQMETPEDVEILPVPKKYDQLGPMRFDKIAKLFGFRIRLIQNGTTTSMPYQILGDDSISSPHYNDILFEGSFPVRPGIDNVYEIQLPKNVNSDIFRLVLGPVNDSFHRYDVLMKIQSSGMQGQSKWMPIR